MKQLIKRLSLPTPAFFKKVRTTGAALASIGTAIKIMPETIDVSGSQLYNFIAPFAIEFIVAGAVMALVAQATVVPDVPNHKL